MTVPPRLPADRDPGDNWAVTADGTRYWGAFGAAGLLAYDPTRGVLLQHRAQWSHHGRTWGIPGGARHVGEPALDAALREASEEAGVPGSAIAPAATHVLEIDTWTYTTVLARVVTPFEPVATDHESLELAWVPLDQVAARALHPGFARSWPELRASLEWRPTLVVDAANVVGSVPDGWWRDRVSATARLIARLETLAATGLPAHDWDLPLHSWFPRIVAVVEGRSRGAAPAPGVAVIDAPGSGDDAIVAQAHTLAASGQRVTVVTSDRALQTRVAGVAQVRGAGWLVERLG